MVTGSDITQTRGGRAGAARSVNRKCKQTECMMALKTLLSLGVLAVVLVGGHCAAVPMPGAPMNISRNDHGVRQAAIAAARFYNDQSNDAFLFKPSAILSAQRQLVKGYRYVLDLDISRTVCPKRHNDNNLSNCDVQPEGPLHQTFQCHTVVWVIPWQHHTSTEAFRCNP